MLMIRVGSEGDKGAPVKTRVGISRPRARAPFLFQVKRRERSGQDQMKLDDYQYRLWG